MKKSKYFDFFPVKSQKHISFVIEGWFFK